MYPADLGDPLQENGVASGPAPECGGNAGHSRCAYSNHVGWRPRPRVAALVLRGRIARLRINRAPPRRSDPSPKRQRADPWQRPTGTTLALVENDHDGHTSLAGSERKPARSRDLRQCARRRIYTLRHRVRPAQARPDREATVSLARHKARVSAPLATHLCVNGAAIYERPSKGFAVARTCAHA